MRHRLFARAATAGAAATLLASAAVLAGTPLAASAHVRVNPGQAEPGSYTTLTFKVPNESATASTVRLEVDLPADTPFTSVSYQPVPGWSASVVVGDLPTPITDGDATITEAPLSVVWTADAGTPGVAPGQFQEFPLSVGPVPDVGKVVLPAHQGYSDGTVVDWDEPTPASGEEPELPAPTLYITEAPPVPADEAGAGASGAGGAGAATVTPSGAAAESSGGADASASAAADTASLALGFGIGGLVLGALGLVLGAVAILRRPGGIAPANASASSSGAPTGPAATAEPSGAAGLTGTAGPSGAAGPTGAAEAARPAGPAGAAEPAPAGPAGAADAIRPAGASGPTGPAAPETATPNDGRDRR